MTRGSTAVCAAVLLLTLTVVIHATGRPQGLNAAGPQDGKASSLPATSEYLGSESCARCHDVEHTQWKNSLHIKMTKPIAEATVLGDFREGTKFADHDRAYTFGRKDGKPTVTISFGGGVPQPFNVDYTLGSKRYQGYLSMLPEGRIYVLPLFWHVASQRWIDWKEITSVPEGAHNLRQIWNSNCFNCHATNIVQGYSVAEQRYNTTWTEMGIGCEACHGPGLQHVTLMDAWEKDPASRPNYDPSSKNRQLTDIFKILTVRSAEPRRIYDTCAYCHGNKRNVFLGFKGGDHYADYAVPFLISDPLPENDLQGEFWPDGRPNRFNRPQALTLSGCFKAGAVACTSCHVAHGSRNEFSLKVNINQGRDGDALCTQCHTQPKSSSPQALTPSFSGPGLEGHTFHKPDSAGSRCISCHMSDVNWRLLIRRRDHTFQPPVPENTVQFGIPNACTTCHDDRSPEWAAKQMDAWWNDGERRSKVASLADTMYRAGSGDNTTLPALAKLAVDRSEGLLIRASAADFIGRLVSEWRTGNTRAGAPTQTSFDGGPTGASTNVLRGDSDRRTTVEPSSNVSRTPPDVTPTIVNALIGAAADPEPVVRAVAVEALGKIGERQRALAPVLARLVDPARVVRAKAAEVLVTFGVVTLPGEAGAALRKAQDDYVARLGAFPDLASNHAARGFFESERGNVSAAREALDHATALAPLSAYPWVLRGVLFAREGKFADAVEMWKKARSIEPSYPNIDQLIAEAEKRR
ncbi:MAG: multiheme c-type cytochrome [Vicinamibacterales bacterium]